MKPLTGLFLVLATTLIFGACSDKANQNNTTTTLLVNDAGGGWVSSGGDLFEYSKNPWFVENTTAVKYCVQLDPSTFSATQEQAIAAIEKSLNYWKREFEGHNLKVDLLIQGGGGFGQFRIANQTFQRLAECDGQQDVQFVFGAGALDSAQRKFLKNPKQHVGVAVRTAYDRVTLRGKGFIYIGSDSGADTVFAPEVAKHGKLFSWSNANYLSAIVTHELGHVFGLAHFGSGLMSESFPNTLTASIVGFSSLRAQCQPTFTPPRSSVGLMTNLRKDHFSWWDIDEERADLQSLWGIYLQQVSGSWHDLRETAPQVEFTVKAFLFKEPNNRTLLGKIVVRRFPVVLTSKYINQTVESLLFLPKEQTVFDGLRTLSGRTVRDLLKSIANKELRESYEKAMAELLDVKLPEMPLLYGVAQMYVSIPAIFVTEKGVEKPILLQGVPGAYSIIGQVDGDLVPVLTTGGLEVNSTNSTGACTFNGESIQ